jgi:hypothetical protein
MKTIRYEIPDTEVLAAIGGGSRVTYVVRNYLSDDRPNLGCTQVRNQLKRMERDGLVVRVSSSYAVQLCWRVAP